MRWKRKYPKPGEERIVKRFLVLPLCLHGEYRWLEMAYMVQTFSCSKEGATGMPVTYWAYTRWTTEKECRRAAGVIIYP